jgi:predicted small lipoprotein YifL
VRVLAAAALLGGAALTLAACGRVGPLEPPPGPALGATPTAAATPGGPPPAVAGPGTPGAASTEVAQKNGFDSYGNPVAPPGTKKSFPLDFLLQ